MSNRISILISVMGVITMMSCENPVSFRTKISEDGSLDKTIALEKAEAKKAKENVFGVSEKNGWLLKTTKPYDSITTKPDPDKFRFEFEKHFTDDEQMNAELDQNVDTLFRVHARWEKKFKWFYSYIRYSETIRPANRFKLVAPEDFFTKEDDSFIQRLPAEGRPISKADSVYLLLLNEKIFDHFANMGMFKETYKIIDDIILQNSLDKKWLDTLAKNQELVYRVIEKDKSDEGFIRKIIDTLNIPLAGEKGMSSYRELSKDFNGRLNFMSFVRDAKFKNEFEMPWVVIKSNADSVAGNKLYWRPMVNKFAYKEYEMYAESRKINWWAFAISILIGAATVYVWRKRQHD